MILDRPEVVFALTMLVGVVAQVLARHAVLPGIVVLLGVGVLLGPDVANVIRPAALGDALFAIVGFAVAVILFEGGMRLQFGELRRQAKPIRRLVLWGAVITAVGGTLACKLAMGWSWRSSILFGTLVIVTGPTVISPLVRRIRLIPSLGTILEAEGVFIDAIGATIAVVALEIAIAPSGEALGVGVLDIALRLGTGALIGALGGGLLGVALRLPRVVPRGLENILALGTAVTVFELSNAFVAESGITAAIAAGLVVGNFRVQRMAELVDFKEQLTVLLISTLFVLLAADVRVADVVALGGGGIATVLALMLVVRPLTVLACTWGAGLSWRERLFVSWMGPRGIVAAAVASLFSVELARAGIEGGVELRALVFLVIAGTVTIQGLSAGPLAKLLGLSRETSTGSVILGANPLARHLAARLGATGQPVVVIDTNDPDCRLAEEAGLKVIYGNGLDRRTLVRARADAKAFAIGVTTNESVNLLFARAVLEDHPGPQALVGVDPRGTGVTPVMVANAEARLLFGRAEDLQGWISRWRRSLVEVVRKEYVPPGDPAADALTSAPEGAVLALLVERKGAFVPVDETTRLRAGDIVELAIAADRREVANAWLNAGAWRTAPPAPEPRPSASGRLPRATTTPP